MIWNEPTALTFDLDEMEEVTPKTFLIESYLDGSRCYGGMHSARSLDMEIYFLGN